MDIFLSNMRKILTGLSALFISLLLPVVVTAAPTSGPVGRNALRVYSGPGVGQVTLEWQRYYLDGENFTLHYGTSTNNYAYAVPYVGYVSTYTIGNLMPGVRYYFAVEGIRVGNNSAGWDGEASAIALSTPTTVKGTAGPVGRNMLWAKVGPKSGQVTLNWTRFFPDTEKYHIVYGLMPGNYLYGVLNAVDATPQDNDYSYTVGSLNPGTRYYFALIPQRSGTGIYVTPEVSVVSK